jgi:hypothetical protein
MKRQLQYLELGSGISNSTLELDTCSAVLKPLNYNNH